MLLVDHQHRQKHFLKKEFPLQTFLYVLMYSLYHVTAKIKEKAKKNYNRVWPLSHDADCDIFDFSLSLENRRENLFLHAGRCRQPLMIPLLFLHEPLNSRRENDGPGERRRNSIRARTAALPLKGEPLSGSAGPRQPQNDYKYCITNKGFLLTSPQTEWTMLVKLSELVKLQHCCHGVVEVPVVTYVRTAAESDDQ